MARAKVARDSEKFSSRNEGLIGGAISLRTLRRRPRGGARILRPLPPSLVYRKPQRGRARWETKGEEGRVVESCTYTKAKREGEGWPPRTDERPRKRIGVRRVKHHRQDYSGVSPVSRCFIAMTSPGFPSRVQRLAARWRGKSGETLE